MFSLVSTAAVFGTIMLPGEFPYHYVDFLAPFAFVTLGLGAGTIAERLIAARATVLAFSSLAILAVAAVLALDIPVLSPPIANNFGAIVDQYVPPGSCVVTDFIGFTIAANRYVNRQPGCPVIVDPFGLDLALDNGRTPPDRGRPTAAVVAAWHSAFAHTDWVVLTRTFHTRIFFVRSVRRYFYRNFTALSSPYFKVFERTSLLKAARRST
jgi:hypothetical protein